MGSMDDPAGPGTRNNARESPLTPTSALEQAARLRSYLDHQLAEQIKLARDAQSRLYLPKGPDRDKTVAASSDGRTAISGWDTIHDPDHHSEAVRVRATQIGHRLERHGFDDEFVGQYYASHAEKKLAEVAPNQPLAVSRPMCDDCQRYFQRLAEAHVHAQVIMDMEGMHIFLPDGVYVRFTDREIA